MTETAHIAIVPLTRGALNEHLRSLVELDQATSRELGTRFDSQGWGENEFKAEREGKWDLSTCAIGDRGPVGYVVASRFEDNAHIHRVAVAQHYRGRHLGTRLVKATTSRARGMGLVRCTVQTPAGNTTARDFYLHLGFVVCNETEVEWYVSARRAGGYARDGLLDQPEGDYWVLVIDLMEPGAHLSSHSARAGEL